MEMDAKNKHINLKGMTREVKEVASLFGIESFQLLILLFENI